MNNYVVVSADGVIQRSGIVENPDDLELQVIADGETIVRGVSGRPGLDRVVNGEVSAIPVPAAPAPTVEQMKATLLARLAERRWEVETGGIQVGGARVATDDRSKLLIADAARRADSDPEFTTRWKAENGWVILDASTIIAVRDAVFAHVASCFAREGDLADMITSADVVTEDLAAAVEAFWP